MGSDKYRLKWSKYENNILDAFRSLLETEALSDVTLFCEGQTFKAHRLVLAACSTHFANLFSHAPVNAPSHTQLFVILDGTRADDLQVLLQFMYRGEAYLHQDRINSVLRTAEVLQIKGLTQVPNEINEQNLSGGASIVGTPSASNARRWSPTHESPPHRATVGIMGHMSRTHHIRKEPREPPPRDLHRDLVDASPPPGPSAHHLLPGSSSHHSSGHHAAARSISPDHAFAYPTSRVGENFSSVYGSGSRFNLPNFNRSSNRDYSPTPGQVRDRSPPDRGRSYGSASGGTPTLIPKEEREDFMDYRSGNGGSRSGSLTHHDRNTPASDKASERHTPASHHGDRERDYERGSSRNTPPSPVVTPSSLGKSTPSATAAPTFPSDSTTDYAKAASSSNFKERIRRSSESTVVTTVGGLPGGDEGNEASERSKFHEFRREADQTLRVQSPSGGRSETRLPNEEDAQAANQLEAFRRIAQAQAERDRFLPRGAGVLHGGISAAATIAAQGLTGSASDYMRLAMPVREADNGDAISGSGTKLKCPFCERTYGYETNLRAHIRQRHQGIRVSCPYCPRTFTRNNTVRRHVAREHRHVGARIPTKFGSTRVMPDPIRIAQLTTAAVQLGQGPAGTAPSLVNSNLSVNDSGNNGGSPPPAPPASSAAPNP